MKYLWLTGVLALAVVPLGLSNYGWYILAVTMVYALVALSLNILVGMAGQISIGHAGFWALGAYGSALAMQSFGVPFIVAIFVGGAVAAVFYDWVVKARAEAAEVVELRSEERAAA
jgi:branched-chain amino acid transport system permease protein